MALNMWAHSTNLVWAVNIVPTCNDDGELKTAVVGLDEEFSGGLGRRVWVYPAERPSNMTLLSSGTPRAVNFFGTP